MLFSKLLRVSCVNMIIFFFLCLSVTANEGGHVNRDVAEVNRINDMLQQVSKSSAMECTTDQPKCSHLVDSMCNNIWNSKNSGNMDIADGKIFFGKSNKSKLDAVRKINIEAILDNEKNFPVDLQKKGESVLNELRETMNRESDSKDWYDRLDENMRQWEDVIENVARERAEAESPELKNIKNEDLTIEQKNKYVIKKLDLKNEIIKAKYENGPNWQRVKRVFKEVKTDLLAQIKGLNLPDALKKRMHDKVNSIVLSFHFLIQELSSSK